MEGASEECQRTAFHEAGHAVVAVLEGVPFTRVTVRPDSGVIDLSEPRTEAEALAYIRASWAGVVAECKRFGKCDVKAARTDEIQRARALQRLQEITGRRPRIALAAEYGPASACLNQHWAFVERVARALLESGTLTRERVEHIRMQD